MIVTVSQGLALLCGLWLIGLGVWMALAPRQALRALAAMGGTALVHFAEMALRIVAGAALMLAAPASRFPTPILAIGAFLIVSALILMVLPRRWHAGYSTWWADRIPVWAVRVVAPSSVLIGGALIWTMI